MPSTGKQFHPEGDRKDAFFSAVVVAIGVLVLAVFLIDGWPGLALGILAGLLSVGYAAMRRLRVIELGEDTIIERAGPRTMVLPLDTIRGVTLEWADQGSPFNQHPDIGLVHVDGSTLAWLKQHAG